MSPTAVVAALEDIASTAVRREAYDVYRFAMSALGFYLIDPARYVSTAEAVIDGCRLYLAKQR